MQTKPSSTLPLRDSRPNLGEHLSCQKPKFLAKPPETCSTTTMCCQATNHMRIASAVSKCLTLTIPLHGLPLRPQLSHVIFLLGDAEAPPSDITSFHGRGTNTCMFMATSRHLILRPGPCVSYIFQSKPHQLFVNSTNPVVSNSSRSSAALQAANFNTSSSVLPIKTHNSVYTATAANNETVRQGN